HGGDLLSEVLLLLLDALALLKADGVLEGHLSACGLGGGGDILLHAHGVVLHELLLQQAVLGVELVQLAHDDLLPHGLGLGGHLGIVLHLDHHDLLLLVQDVLAHLRLVPEAGVQSGNLHGHVLADLLHLLSGQVGLQVHQHTDLAAGVHIGHGDVLGEAGEAADLDVLADHQHHLLLLLGDGQ
ncbi:Ribosome hibernation promoting factor, partial [Dysosmobacter welbionis]